MRPHLPALGETLGRRERIGSVGHVGQIAAWNLTASPPCALRMRGRVAGDAIQEGALGAKPHGLQPAHRDHERALDLVIDIGLRNARGQQRARDEVAVFVDHRTYPARSGPAPAQASRPSAHPSKRTAHVDSVNRNPRAPTGPERDETRRKRRRRINEAIACDATDKREDSARISFDDIRLGREGRSGAHPLGCEGLGTRIFEGLSVSAASA